MFDKHNQLKDVKFYFQKQVTYDVVQKMRYLEMCLSEVLRLYPSGQRYWHLDCFDFWLIWITVTPCSM